MRTSKVTRPCLSGTSHCTTFAQLQPDLAKHVVRAASEKASGSAHAVISNSLILNQIDIK